MAMTDINRKALDTCESNSVGGRVRTHVNSIELFSGVGGLALGLQQAGFRHKALYEKDKASCENIEANILTPFPGIVDWQIVRRDVRTVSYDGMTGNIELVSGGPPCQPFSLGGKAQAYNDSRDMFPEAVRAVREVQPKIFLFENVKGLLRKSFSLYFNYIILQLTYPSIVKPQGASWMEHYALLEQHHTSGGRRACEYNVLFRLLNAADYGVPQQRYRVFIVGFRHDVDAHWSFPPASHSYESLLYSKWIKGDYWERHHMKPPAANPLTPSTQRRIRRVTEDTENPPLPWITTRDAIGDMPDPTSPLASSCDNHSFRVGAKVYPGHSGSSLDEPSKTIKAGAHGVPGGENMLRLDSGTVRYYTVRECARIQTFPDNYRFISSQTECMRQIGNAVPVTLARTLGTSLYALIAPVNHAQKQHSGHQAV